MGRKHLGCQPAVLERTGQPRVWDARLPPRSWLLRASCSLLSLPPGHRGLLVSDSPTSREPLSMARRPGSLQRAEGRCWRGSLVTPAQPWARVDGAATVARGPSPSFLSPVACAQWTVPVSLLNAPTTPEPCRVCWGRQRSLSRAHGGSAGPAESQCRPRTLQAAVSSCFLEGVRSQANV